MRLVSEILANRTRSTTRITSCSVILFFVDNIFFCQNNGCSSTQSTTALTGWPRSRPRSWNARRNGLDRNTGTFRMDLCQPKNSYGSQFYSPTLAHSRTWRAGTGRGIAMGTESTCSEHLLQLRQTRSCLEFGCSFPNKRFCSGPVKFLFEIWILAASISNNC